MGVFWGLERQGQPFPTVCRLAFAASGVGEVAGYIARQEEHHRKRSFSEELRRLVERYGLQWHQEKETVENGSLRSGPPEHPAEAGC